MEVLEEFFWFGCAGLGFAILFNVPKRTLLSIFIMAGIGGTVKLAVVHWADSLILGTLTGCVVIGFWSIYAAHNRHSPPFVLAIPAVIPMVPGTLAYRTMRGILDLASAHDSADMAPLLQHTVSNGLQTSFVLLAIAFGVSAPMLITGRESVKNMRLPSLGADKRE